MLAIDLENPVFSDDRASLLRFVPDEFNFVPTSKTHPDELTARVIAAIEAVNPAPNSVDAKFLDALRSTDPVRLLADSVDAYHARISSRLTNPQTKQAEIDRLFALLVQRRRSALEHEILSELNETGDRLFPVP